MKPPVDNTITFKKATTADELDRARRLQGRRYLDAGYVDSLTADGYIDDRFVDLSTYFIAVKDAEVVGVIRLIHSHGKDLPALTEFAVHADWAALMAGLDDTEVDEISALAVDENASEQSFVISLGLYREMWQDTRRHRRASYWLATLDKGIYGLMTRIMGFPFKIIGDERDYMGITFPTALSLTELADTIIESKPELAAYFVDGLEPELHPEGIQKILAAA